MVWFEIMDWAETLPSQCPPAEATQPNNTAYYRYVDTIPLCEADFHSQRKLLPLKLFRVDECTARAVSVFSNPEKIKSLSKLPSFRGKKLVEIILPPESGKIIKSGKEHHYSWWRVKNFIPATHKLVAI